MSDSSDIRITEGDIFRFNENEQFTFSEPEPQLQSDVSNIVILDNLPQPDAAKTPKLTELIGKIFAKKAPECKVISLKMATDASGAGKGFCFAEVENAEQVEAAIKGIEGFQIEKGRNIVCATVKELEQYENINIDEMQKQMEEQAKSAGGAGKPIKELEDMQFWLKDRLARDQYALRHWDTVDIYWNDPVLKRELAYSRQRWTEDRINWSPQGSYIVTWHSKGIALWGGPSWKTQSSFPHPNPRLIDFSPRERYIVTANDDKKDNVVVWEVRTAKRMKTFTIPVEKLRAGWPLFKWSFDEKHFATLAPENSGLWVFNTNNFKHQTVEIAKIQDFEWSPSQSVLAYWTPEQGTAPAKVSILEVPKMTELRFKNFFGVLENGIKFFWNNNGNYLGVQVDRLAAGKKKKTAAKAELTFKDMMALSEGATLAPAAIVPDVTNIEIFRLNAGKDIPVETIEISDTLFSLSWEDSGDKFALVTGDLPAGRKTITVYSLEGNKTRVVSALADKNFDKVVWSPKGRFFVLMNTKSSNGLLEFYDAEDLRQPVNTGEHFMMTDIAWDPTGRYVATSVSAYQRSQENGYIIWNTLGEIVHKQQQDKLWQFVWRPRPPTLLSEGQEKQLKKMLPKKKKQYQDEEKAAKDKATKEQQEAKAAVWTDYLELEDRLRKEFEKDQKEREKLFGYSVLGVLPEEVIEIEEQPLDE